MKHIEIFDFDKEPYFKENSNLDVWLAESKRGIPDDFRDLHYALEKQESINIHRWSNGVSKSRNFEKMMDCDAIIFLPDSDSAEGDFTLGKGLHDMVLTTENEMMQFVYFQGNFYIPHEDDIGNVMLIMIGNDDWRKWAKMPADLMMIESGATLHDTLSPASYKERHESKTCEDHLKDHSLTPDESFFPKSESKDDEEDYFADY